MLSIIIPTYNEEKTISQVIRSVQEAFFDTPHEIIIVDDGSKDNTQNICNLELEKEKNEIRYIRLEKNKGKGKALRVGFGEAKGSFVAIQDADLEYNPKILRELYSQAKENSVIYGRRDRENGYFWTIIGSIFLSRLCNLLYGSNLFDIYTCYKIIPNETLQSLELISNGFEIEAEITAKLLRAKIKITEIPITYCPRTFEEGKHIRAIDGIIGSWTLIKNRF